MKYNNAQKRKKLIYTGLSLLLMTFLMFSLTACLGKEDYKAYKEAVVKTDAIQKGQRSLSVTVDQTFSNEVKASADYNKFNGLEALKFDLSGQFDYEQDLAIYDLYLFYNQLGNDVKYYQLSDSEHYIKLPMFKTFLQLDQSLSQEVISQDSSVQEDGLAEGNAIEAIMGELSKEWQQMIHAENVFVGEKTTIKNEDGDVKATRFTIKPTTEQLDTITNKIKESLIMHQDEMAMIINQYSNEDLFDGVNFGSFVNDIMNQMTIKQFEEVVFVDVDGYIIEDSITIDIQYSKSDSVTPLFESQKIIIKSQNWAIEQNQKFDFPVIDGSNSQPISTFQYMNQ